MSRDNYLAPAHPGPATMSGLSRADRVYSAIVGRDPEPWGGCDEREIVERVLDVVHAEVQQAVEEATAGRITYTAAEIGENHYGSGSQRAAALAADVQAAINKAVEDAIANGHYCIDCGVENDDWRGHYEHCAYRDPEQEPRSC